MTHPLAFHLLIGLILVALGVTLLRRRPIAGWVCCILGVSMGVMGVVIPHVHRYLFH